MTTQQQPQQPQAEQSLDVALRVGRLEGLMEASIEEQRAHRAETNVRFEAVNARIDALDRKFTVLISGAFMGLLIAILGARFLE